MCNTYRSYLEVSEWTNTITTYNSHSSNKQATNIVKADIVDHHLKQALCLVYKFSLQHADWQIVEKQPQKGHGLQINQM